jgi:hypothetical protein
MTSSIAAGFNLAMGICTFFDSVFEKNDLTAIVLEAPFDSQGDQNTEPRAALKEDLCMSGSGRSFSGEAVRRIIWLLATTDMTIQEIAERMSCCRTTVVSINRKFQVRDYAGFRSHWRIRSHWQDGSTGAIDEEEKSA